MESELLSRVIIGMQSLKVQGLQFSINFTVCTIIIRLAMPTTMN